MYGDPVVNVPRAIFRLLKGTIGLRVWGLGANDYITSTSYI